MSDDQDQADAVALHAQCGEIDEMIAGLDAQIKPLKTRRELLDAERGKLAEKLAGLVQGDAELLAVSGTRTGNDRLNDIARGLHPAIVGFCRWTVEWPTRADAVVPTRVGLVVQLDYRLADTDIARLAAAAWEFPRRFVLDPPKDPRRPGHRVLYIEIRAREGYRWHIEYTPEGDAEHAGLFDPDDDPVYVGTLREVLSQASEIAWHKGGPDTDDVDGY